MFKHSTHNQMRPFKRVRRALDREALARICEMHETDFEVTFDMEKTYVNQASYGDDYEHFYLHRDNGSNILAVAHLDTVVAHEKRTAAFCQTAGGEVLYSGALDDRLGAYTILEMLPALGINVDVLLTVGEESGSSTADFFDGHGKEYNWMIEFDRGGTDVVMYQYHDAATEDLVAASGAKVGHGSFSDIAYLEQLGIKGFNWGVGYRDYHGPRSHVWIDDYLLMVSQFVKFHHVNADVALPHDARKGGGGGGWWGGGSFGRSSFAWDDERDDDLVRDPENPSEWIYRYELQEREEGRSELAGLLSKEQEYRETVRELDAARTERERNERQADLETAFADDIVSEDFSLVNRQLLAREASEPILDGNGKVVGARR